MTMKTKNRPSIAKPASAKARQLRQWRQSAKHPKGGRRKIGACPHFSRLQVHETTHTYEQLGSFRTVAIGFVFLEAPNS